MILKESDPASLDQLHDIIMAEPIPWFPPAPGWILLTILLVILFVLFLIQKFLLWRSNAYRRAALAELKLISTRSDSGHQKQEQFREAAEILKRTALVIAPRENIAGLSGNEWISWLNYNGAGTLFNKETAQLLEQTIYEADSVELSEDRFEKGMKSIRSWIISHQVKHTTGGPK